MSGGRQLHPDASGAIHPDRESALEATIRIGEKQKADEKAQKASKRKARKAKASKKTGSRKTRSKKKA